MLAFDAIGAMATGHADISEVMFAQGLIITAIIILGLNIWTTNDNALYGSGLGFANITNNRHLILKSAHPSPFAAHRGFFGSKPFSKTNNFLIKNNMSPIDWQIEETVAK